VATDDVAEAVDAPDAAADEPIAVEPIADEPTADAGDELSRDPDDGTDEAPPA